MYRARSDRETAGSALPPTYASLGSCLPRSTSLHSLPLHSPPQGPVGDRGVGGVNGVNEVGKGEEVR